MINFVKFLKKNYIPATPIQENTTISTQLNLQGSSYKFILPLGSPHARLELAGGKGANLSRLVRAGFHVPPGFIVTTYAYMVFLLKNSLSQRIEQHLAGINSLDTTYLNEVARDIRNLFDSGTMPGEIEEEIRTAYGDLEGKSVAVRSSATAEDLPGFSFAGQQDTYLNIIDFPHLMQAVISCWGSLWTARAIGYRERNQIPHAGVSQAVVVQEMVPSTASGVMFTANPVSGSRFETVIDATLGIGEALVSGQVEPDHFLVDRRMGQVTKRQVGAKSVAMYPAQEGGLRTEPNPMPHETAIPDQVILELSELGGRVAQEFGFPQDIEWAYYQEQIYLLQARPITSLYPLPEKMPFEPLKALFSFGAIQGILDPMTPLGQDAIRLIFAGGASLFNLDFDHRSQPVITSAGQRLWANITPLLQNPLGARIIPRVFSAIDPSLKNILAKLTSDPGLGVGSGRIRLSSLTRIARFVFPFLRRTFHYIRKPQGVAEKIQKDSHEEIQRITKKYNLDANRSMTLPQLVELYQEIFNAFPYVVPEIAPGAAGGIIPFFLLNKISESLTGSNQIALEITRGLDHNITTQMDLQLWNTAGQIRSEPAAMALFRGGNPQQITQAFKTNQLPGRAQEAINRFIDSFGMRGIGEIDIGRPRWREDPAYVIGVILGYLQITDHDLAPDTLFEKGRQEAQAAIQKLQTAAEATFAGKFKSRLIAHLAQAVRQLAGLRESPKFHIIQLMGLIRAEFLFTGEQLMVEGKIERPGDLFYLTFDQLQAYARGEIRDWQQIISEQRKSYQHEELRTRIPRLLLSDGRAYFEGLTHESGEAGLMAGSPVSPGTVEGPVRVVVDPLHSGLKPGEIMVCPGTDPAWTPLFMTAAGLVMEVGGMMTHGAIVAREYGIPAVVGVDQATSHLHTGQQVKLDGTTGEIFLLDQD